MSRPMSSGIFCNSSSMSMTDATCRPRSNSVSRTSRSCEPVAGGDWPEPYVLMETRGGLKNTYTWRGRQDMKLTLPLDYSAIERILPHQYPFLLVDRVTEFDSDKRIVGVKNVSQNDRYLWRGEGERPV